MRQDTHDASLLTLAQAKVVWCPEARALQQEVSPVYPGIDGANRLATAPASCNRASLRDGDSVTIEPSRAAMCLGDACAFWRWHDSGERVQEPKVIDFRTLVNDAMPARTDGEWEYYLPQHDEVFRTWKGAVMFVLERHDIVGEDAECIGETHVCEDQASGDIIRLLADTAVTCRLISPTLPPRGYCGKAGHPHQARLLEAQMELLGYQLHEHRLGV